MVSLRLLDKKALRTFIDSAEFHEMENIPVSKHRALSYINNPHAHDDDILFILAFEDNDLKGYVGVLPDRIELSSGKSEKCGWLSSLWVNPSFRGKGLGTKLIEKSLKTYDDKLFSGDYVPGTKRLYDKTNSFFSLPAREGVRLYIRSDLLKLLPPKRKIFQKIKPVLKITDSFLNLFLNLRLQFLNRQSSPINFEFVDHVDKEVDEFISRKQGKELFRRKSSEFNWIMNYPWILSPPEKDPLNGQYHFTSVARSFGFYGIKIQNQEGALKAFLILMRRDQELKLPYCYFDSDAINDVVKLVNYFILKWKINTFTTFNSELSKYFLDHKTIGYYKKRMKRYYLASNHFQGLLDDFEVQDGDGDLVFT